MAEQRAEREAAVENWQLASADTIKQFFCVAYNEMAQSHNVDARCNEAATNVLLDRLGYTEDELRVIGEDAWLMQSTGNPHIRASVGPGDFVLDLGSGFGLDAFIAGAKCEPNGGRVVGIDLSIEEVTSALRRAQKRHVRNVDFRLGDIEDIPIHDNTVDCVISNGGFCLVPDKRKAFSEVFRVLKHGGRMAISCTVRKIAKLDSSKDWPSCMVVFAGLHELPEILDKCGFVDVEIDMSNCRMDVWNDVKEEFGDLRSVTIHRGDSRYEFLKSLDMNKMFGRAIISGRKPRSPS